MRPQQRSVFNRRRQYTHFAGVDWLTEQYREFSAAARFLSILPLPEIPPVIEFEGEEPPLQVGSAYFSLVGFILAGVLWLFIWLSGSLLPSLALAAIIVVFEVILTGGLHLDGLMDSCDGLFGGRTVERKLEIMRDSRVGSFGVLGGICILLLKWAFLASIAPAHLGAAVCMALPCTRWGMVVALRTFPPARPDGLGALFRQTVTNEKVIIAGLIAIAIALLAGQLLGVFIWMIAGATALTIGLIITRMLGGLTGDTYGAIAELSEVIVLLMLVLFRL